MAFIMAQADAKIVRQPKEGLGAKVSFFNFPEDRSLPHASMNGHTGNVVGDAHFHINDQFQVVVDGEFSIGRHQLSPYCVHFSRAYTPYGPLVPKNGGDYTFVVMRARWDNGPQFIAKEMEQLRAATDRQPWQISRRVDFPPSEARKNAGDVMLQAVPEVKDDHGLAVQTLVMKPNAKASAPNPAHTDGQYLLVVKGSLWHDNKEHKAITLVFVKPDEGPYQLHAGPEGLEAIILNFPERMPRSNRAEAPAAAAGSKKWQCALCAFEYDEALGMPAEGIAAGTRWADVPDTWMCPDCSAAKSDFQMVEVRATAEVA